MASKQNLKPRFSRLSNGELRLNYSDEARKFMNESQTDVPKEMCENAGDIKRNAMAEVQRLGGDTKDELAVLGQYIIQFGRFKSKTLKWLVENGLGYSGWLVDNMRSETATTAPLSQNKHAFKRYLNVFKEGQDVLKSKAAERIKKSTTGVRAPSSNVVASVSSLLLSNRPVNPEVLKAKVSRIFTHAKIKPSIPSLISTTFHSTFQCFIF